MTIQASVSGTPFLVHITHDPTDGTDLDLPSAQKLLAELEQAVGNVEQGIFQRVQADAAVTRDAQTAEAAAAQAVEDAANAEPSVGDQGMPNSPPVDAGATVDQPSTDQPPSVTPSEQSPVAPPATDQSPVSAAQPASDQPAADQTDVNLSPSATRDELNQAAAQAGVANPEALPNKDAVIETAQAVAAGETDPTDPTAVAADLSTTAKRDELNQAAADVGVAAPEVLPNKDAVIEAAQAVAAGEPDPTSGDSAA